MQLLYTKCNKYTKFLHKIIPLGRRLCDTMNILISFMQTFGIILVVIGHCGVDIPILKPWIYSFHMPLFIFIAGYLLQYTTPTISSLKTLSFAKKKAIRLLLPYVLISSIAYLPKCLFTVFTYRSTELSLTSYLHGMFYPSENPIIFFWFLPTLFFIFMLTLLCYKACDKLHIPIPSALLLLLSIVFYYTNPVTITFLNLHCIFPYWIYFMCGIYYAKYQKQFDTFFHTESLYALAIVCLATASYFFLNNPSIIFVPVLYALIGILLTICLGKQYAIHKYKFLHHLFGYSFTIYLFSWFAQVFVRIVCIQLLDFHWTILLPISTIAGIYGPICFQKITSFFYSKYKLHKKHI